MHFPIFFVLCSAFLQVFASCNANGFYPTTLSSNANPNNPTVRTTDLSPQIRFDDKNLDDTDEHAVKPFESVEYWEDFYKLETDTWDWSVSTPPLAL